MPGVPVLETERLILRGPRRDDLDAYAAMWGDPAVTRHIGGRAFTREEVWARLLRDIGHWVALGHGFWIACEREGGRFVGAVGIADFQRDLDPPLEAPEAGWVLSPSAHGRGLATEAVGAVLAWADAHLDAPRTVCLIDPDNTASLRVAAKCGYGGAAPLTYKGDPVLRLERARR